MGKINELPQFEKFLKTQKNETTNDLASSCPSISNLVTLYRVDQMEAELRTVQCSFKGNTLECLSEHDPKTEQGRKNSNMECAKRSVVLEKLQKVFKPLALHPSKKLQEFSLSIIFQLKRCFEHTR